MKKQDYEILAAAIKRHGQERGPDYTNMTAEQAARYCARKIAGTFAHFAHVDKSAFLKACGVE